MHEEIRREVRASIRGGEGDDAVLVSRERRSRRQSPRPHHQQTPPQR